MAVRRETDISCSGHHWALLDSDVGMGCARGFQALLPSPVDCDWKQVQTFGQHGAGAHEGLLTHAPLQETSALPS